jgi:hypothetical protein
VPTPDFDNEAFDNKNDDRFEVYLKQFLPLAIEPLRIDTPGRDARRPLTLAAWAAAAAVVILIASVLMLYPGAGRTDSSASPGNSADGDRLPDSQPLTLGSANALLTRSPSVKAALDGVPFHPPSTQLPKGKQSALAVLSEDKDKL